MAGRLRDCLRAPWGSATRRTTRLRGFDRAEKARVRGVMPGRGALVKRRVFRASNSVRDVMTQIRGSAASGQGLQWRGPSKEALTQP